MTSTFLWERSILTPLNEDAEMLNRMATFLMGEREEDSSVYNAVDTLEDEDGPNGSLIPAEFLNSLSPLGLPLQVDFDDWAAKHDDPQHERPKKVFATARGSGKLHSIRTASSLRFRTRIRNCNL